MTVLGSVSYFRSTKPHITLEKNYPEEFHIDIEYEPQLDNDNWLKQYDIIHYHRTLGDPNKMEALIKKLDDLGIISIMDLDDYWSVGPHHPLYNLVKESGLDKQILNNIKLASNVTTTTDIFANEIKKFNKNVFVLPNAIDPTEKQYIPNPEESERLRIGWLGGSCVCPDTEILTNKGWMYFENLDGTETVATLNSNTNEVEYHKPKNYIKEFHNGDVYVCDTNEISFKLTGNHNMYVSEAKSLTHKKLEYNLTMMDDLFGKDLHFKKNGVWIKEGVEYFILPSVDSKPYDKQNYSEKKILMDDWVKFYGFWLADGWVNNGDYGTGICQFKSTDILHELKNIMNKYDIDFKFSKCGNQIRSGNRQLHTYLKQFGSANQKYIHRDLLDNLSSKQLELLLEYYLLGDGSKEQIGEYIRKRAYTVSKQLSDDLMELAFKIGNSVSIKNRGMRYPKVSLKENGEKRHIKPNYDSYQIGFYEKNSKHNKLTPLVRKEKITKEHYEGYVYCVEVENHIIYVRRNGKPMWIGNSHLHDLTILKGVVNSLGPDLLNKLQFVLCGFDLRGVVTIIDPKTKQKTQRPIQPKESVWYEYEKIFTDDYKIVSPEYKNFLLQFKNEEYPNIANEPYRRVWTKPISTYATNYNLFDVSLAPLEENIFNFVKSQLKVVEAGFHNKAIMVQDFGPYQIDLTNINVFGGGINPDGNAILIDSGKNHKDWAKNIKKLVDNPEIVQQLRNNLSKTITEKYSINKVTSDRRNLYLSLLKNKKK